MSGYSELLEVAKLILDLNSNSCLTGTLMLTLRGYDIGRDAGDIDILIKDYAENIVFPDGYDFEKIGVASDGFSAKYFQSHIC